MSHSHAHSHGGTATGRHRRRLAIVLTITLAVMVVEVVGAAISGSMALLADAGHMLTDSGGLALALFATWLAGRPATSRRTFGWQRAEILAALANGLLLLVICASVITEGIDRALHPRVDIEVGVMVAVAVVGLVANLIGVRVLATGRSESLNVQGAYLEVLGDLLGSVAVLVAALGLQLGFARADGLASIAIGLLIAPRAFSLLRDVVHVLLEGTPSSIDLAEVREHMERVPGVLGVHDVHAWTISSGVPVMSAHVEVEPDWLADGRGVGILTRLRSCLGGHFDVDHCTFQLEPPHLRADERHAHR